MTNKLLITGGCGFIGTNLIAKIQAKGNYDIRVLDNLSIGSKENLSDFSDIEFINGDIRDSKAVLKALDGVTCVIHLAADTRVIDSIKDPLFNFDVNVSGTINILNQMRKNGVTKIINASTGGAILGDVKPPVNEYMLPEPVSPYGASKLSVEGYLSAFSNSYGFNAVSLRFSNVYGPRSWHKGSVVAHFFKNILSGKDLTVYGDGWQKRDYIHVHDICEGIYQILNDDIIGVYQLGSGMPVSINQLIAYIRETVGQDFPFKVHYKDFRSGELLHSWCDIKKAKETFGFDPKLNISTGLKQTWKWFENSLLN
jgi:UDP-glucose 4-epimerase